MKKKSCMIKISSIIKRVHTLTLHVSKVYVYIHIYINIIDTRARAHIHILAHTHWSQILVQFSSGIRTCAIIHLWFSSSVSPLFVISSNTSWESIWCLIVKLLDGWFFRRSPALWSIRFHEYLFPAASAARSHDLSNFPVVYREKKKKKKNIENDSKSCDSPNGCKFNSMPIILIRFLIEFSKTITRFRRLSHEWFSFFILINHLRSLYRNSIRFENDRLFRKIFQKI